MCNRVISSRRIDCFFFSVKLYDHQGPIARGVVPPPPLTVRVMRNALTGRGLIHMSLVMMLLRRRREILHFEITETINNGLILLINGSLFQYLAVFHILAPISIHMRLMLMPLARNFCALKSRNSFSQ